MQLTEHRLFNKCLATISAARKALTGALKGDAFQVSLDHLDPHDGDIKNMGRDIKNMGKDRRHL